MPPGLTGCCRGIAVKQLWLGWAKRAVQAARMAGQRGRRRRAPRSAWMAEMLESRQLLTLTLPQPLVNDVPVGKSGLIALPVTNDTSNPVSFQVTSDNPQVTATVLQGGRSLLMNVSGKDGSNVDFTGDLVFRLFETEAPQTVARIESFANSNFYDNLTFHRILPGFVAQGGDPNGNGTGGSGTKLPDEYATNLTFTSQGLLAMANSGDDTGDSQFFITALDQTLSQLPQHLNFQHTVFGILTGGFDTFRKLIATPTIGNGSGTPVSKPVINNVTLFTDNQPGVVRVTPAAGFTGTVNLTVNANDGNGAVAQRVVPVTVVADTVNDRAFLGAVSNQTAIQGRPVSFTVQGFDLENDNLTFQIRDAASWSANDSTGTAPANVATNISVTPASNGNPAVATITLTPSVTFSGTVNLRLGVRDQVARDGLTLDQRGNFDTQAFTLTVSPVNHAPNAPGGTVSTPANTAVNITLPGDDGDPDKTQVLTYSIVSQPNSGTISALNPTTGALIYTPATGFNGVVTFTYRISDDGGTANSGADTSTTATYTVLVGSQSPATPVLPSDSDNGTFNNDRVTSVATPRITTTGPNGSTVNFQVNGGANILATETSPGNFAVNLPAGTLRVGANSITATSTQGGSTSSPTTPMTVTYAPDYSQVYTVPGNIAGSQQLTFQWVSRSAAYNSEFGFFVASANGSVGGVAPGSAGFTRAALSSSTRQTVFAPGTAMGTTRTVTLTGGQTLGFYLVTRGTAQQVLQSNSAAAADVWFSSVAGNSDGLDHVHTQADSHTGRVLLSWEDMRGGGDRDYNDAVFSVTPGAVANIGAAEPIRLPGTSDRTVNAQFKLEPTTRGSGRPGKSVADGEIGFYFVSDAGGTVAGIAPGAAGYMAAALATANRRTVFSNNDALNTPKSVTAPGGELIGWYYIPGGTAASALASNPNNDPTRETKVFYSFDPANPDDANHFRWFGPERNGVVHSASESAQPLRLYLTGGLNPDPNDFADYQIAITQLS